MTIFDPNRKILHELAEASRKHGTSSRQGTIADVMQKGGEQKVRVEIGVDPDGKPLLGPWMSTTEGRSGASSEQHQYKKGQNVRINSTDGDYRQGLVTHQAEGKHAPQPKNAPMHGYGDTYQVGGKLFGGYFGPDESKDDGKGEKNHRHETWISSQDHAPPKHTGESKIMSGDQKPQQPSQTQKKNLEESVMVSTDEGQGFTARVGKNVRVASHSGGSKIVGGDTFFAAHTDKDAVMKSQKDSYITSSMDIYAFAQQMPYVNKPWRIRGRKGVDGIPNDNKLGNGGTRGGHGETKKA